MRFRLSSLLALAGAVALVLTVAASANVTLTQIAFDSYTNSTSQHKTIVEPDTYSFGSTIVAAAQSGRFFDGGSSGIEFATSTNNGGAWTHGQLPGITTFNGGPYARATDPSVAYDARHNVWADIPMSDSLVRLNPATGQWTVFRLPSIGCNSRHFSLDPARDEAGGTAVAVSES